MNSRHSILRGQKPNASHLGALQQADATLRNVRPTMNAILKIEQLALTQDDRNCSSSQTPTSTTHFALQMLRRASGLTRTLPWRKSSRYSYLDDEHHDYHDAIYDRFTSSDFNRICYTIPFIRAIDLLAVYAFL